MTRDIAIQLHNLSRDFGKLRAVDGLTFDVPSGMVFGFLGPNGSGKTTTMHLLLGLLDPTEGYAEIMGLNPQTHGDEVRSQCGALLEHHGLYERLSAVDNLDYYGRIYHMSPTDRQARIQQLLEEFGLWDRRNERIGTWSKGMKQKLAVARALLHRPALVFLDEPTAGFDPIAAAELRDSLARLVNQEGVTVFLTTHNLAEAEKLCKQVAVIRSGKLLAVGNPHTLSKRRSMQVMIEGSGFSPDVLEKLRTQPEVHACKHEANGTLRLEIAPTAHTGPLVRLLIDSGATVEEVRKESQSLEDAFLELMEVEHVS